MKRKQFMIIGLGQFGKSIVSTLHNSNVDLLVIDRDITKLEEIGDKASQAVCGDASKQEVLEQFDIDSFDGAIVTIGHDTEFSVKTVMHLKEMGMPFIMAKADTDFDGRILTKLGADKIIFPDREVGYRLGKEIVFGNYYDALDISDTHSITDIVLPKKWTGKSIIELNLRKTYGINVIGVRRQDDVIVNPTPNFVFKDEDVLIALGSNKDIENVRKIGD